MNDTANNVIDARLQEALSQYFNGVTLRETIGDCAVLSGIRKQNGAPVDIYTPSYAVTSDEAACTQIGKDFERYEKLTSTRLQSAERLLASRAFRKTPALALLSCPVPVFDEAFDTRSVEARLQIFDEILDGLAALHDASIIHGNVNPDAVRRESADGALRLCDFTFAGGRTTKVTRLPPAYQSRHVINNSQARPADDIHSAGMIGYRILLGPHGAEKVLTGTAEPQDGERIVTAILGEDTATPTAEELFTDGHPSAEQISRLLARMTGRLPNAAPYSSAAAALKAFRSVVENPNVGIGGTEPQRTSTAPSPDIAMASAPFMSATSSTGVSRTTAITLFGGFLLSTAAAVYYFVENRATNDTLLLAMQSRASLQDQLAESEGLASALKSAARAMRDADRLVIEARLTGGDSASAASAGFLTEATAAYDSADAAFEIDETDTVLGAAETAAGSAQNALAAIDTARTAMHEAREDAQAAKDAAMLAGGEGMASHDDALALATTATDAMQESRLETAANHWLDAADNFRKTIAELKSAATEAQRAARAAKDDAKPAIGSAGYVLALGLERRAEGAFAGQSFADAVKLFGAAERAFAAASPAQKVAVTTMDADPRSATLGDNPARMAEAVALCLDHAPIADTSCPRERPADEIMREATVTPYEIDATEVSAGEFARFVGETGYVTEAEKNGRIVALTSSGEARFIDGGFSWRAPGGMATTYETAPDLPVTNVSMKDAAAYCAWASGRLPTEAEWESAARDGADAAFPFGAWSPDSLVWRGATDPAFRLPRPVAAAGATNGAGLGGLSGNAREWVLAEDGAVLKGGSWNTANPADLRISARLAVPGNAPGVDFGFRCARDREAWR